jgi:hypothetical protein
MSNIKLLLDVVSNLRLLADSVQAVADAMAGNEPAEAAQPELPSPAPELKPEVKPVTLEQVRAALLGPGRKPQYLRKRYMGSKKTLCRW